MADPRSPKGLAELLGAAPPASVAELPPDARDELADLLREARRAQAADLQEAFAQSLRYVPFPVRGIVKRVLLG